MILAILIAAAILSAIVAYASMEGARSLLPTRPPPIGLIGRTEGVIGEIFGAVLGAVTAVVSLVYPPAGAVMGAMVGGVYAAIDEARSGYEART